MPAQDEPAGAPDGASFSARGHVDTVAHSTLKGWAVRNDRQDIAATVELFIDDVRVGLAECKSYRTDLRDARIRGGFAGFEFPIPSAFLDGLPHRIHARVPGASDGHGLPGLAEFSDYDPTARRDHFQHYYRSAVLSTSFPGRSAEVLKRMGKLAIFCSYFEQPFFSAYHERMLESLRKSGYWILCVHSLAEDMPQPAAPRQADGYLVKKNHGYDFGSWLAGIHFLQEFLPGLEHMVLINDSVLGPFNDLAGLFGNMEADPADFWGLIDSFQTNYHLQSFCLGFKKRILQSSFFTSFCSSFSFSDDKGVVIQEGELSLTRKLTQQGFLPATAFKYEDVASHWVKKWRGELHGKKPDRNAAPDLARSRLLALIEDVEAGIPMNPTHLFWDSLIELGFPFIKRELLFKNPMNLPNLHLAKRLIASHSDYDLALIEHASRFFPVSRIYL
ncbi:hypothetical protein ASD15_15245 [Massilia sp. Root351]|nr:hypothetical protein ASD15_15245 [Massilia sp. Root351]